MTEVLTWDDRCKKIFGLPADFPVTYEWHLKALHPDDLERVSKAGAIALHEQTEFHEEYRTFYLRSHCDRPGTFRFSIFLTAAD
ncbi:MAG: PAS domain-containing protein [Pleurocapsa sp. SU_5_0]|nr:PAS domain-containing protein [Pleurocapsa sp. SU_5_0]